MRLIFFVTLGLAAATAQAASFNCAKATHPVEKLICANRGLSLLDENLAEAYELEVGRGKDLAALRARQRGWIASRNACKDAACVRQHMEERTTELSCSPAGSLIGSAIGAAQCAEFSRQGVEKELAALEERQARRLSAQSNNPDYAQRSFDEERKAWRQYRVAKCVLYGALEGGSDGWKNAFASMCELDESKQRLQALKQEEGAK